jgi:hypothetical protein
MKHGMKVERKMKRAKRNQRSVSKK